MKVKDFSWKTTLETTFSKVQYNDQNKFVYERYNFLVTKKEPEEMDQYHFDKIKIQIELKPELVLVNLTQVEQMIDPNRIDSVKIMLEMFNGILHKYAMVLPHNSELISISMSSAAEASETTFPKKFFEDEKSALAWLFQDRIPILKSKSGRSLFSKSLFK